ncbi:MAG: cytochrome c-type biogenesis protein CcmH [Thaumarchaeota archaeon]|nr:cytochrome c-type biogenesis protein CcmH [Nitrososphaerota archaeon]MCL5317163.1 cytochrome c-type biogenesis protein CcmH [Nitrososphaerota archaeon]
MKPDITENLDGFSDKFLGKTQLTTNEDINGVQQPDDSGKAITGAHKGDNDGDGGRVAIAYVFKSDEDDSEQGKDIGSMMRAVKEMLDDGDGDELVMEFILARYLLRHQSGGGNTLSRPGTLSEQQP